MFRQTTYVQTYSHNLPVFFFFKQKTAYEMRISDWSSDVCSSDLQRRSYHDLARLLRQGHQNLFGQVARQVAARSAIFVDDPLGGHAPLDRQRSKLDGDRPAFSAVDQRVDVERLQGTVRPHEQAFGFLQDRTSTRLNSSH